MTLCAWCSWSHLVLSTPTRRVGLCCLWKCCCRNWRLLLDLMLPPHLQATPAQFLPPLVPGPAPQHLGCFCFFQLLHLLLELKSLKLDTGSHMSVPSQCWLIFGMVSTMTQPCCSTSAQPQPKHYLGLFDLVLLLIEPSLRFLKPGAKPGFVFRHRDLVRLHVRHDPRASLIHRMELVAPLAALSPDLLSEKLQRHFESLRHP